MATIRNATSIATPTTTSVATTHNPGALARAIALTGLITGVVGSIDFTTFFYVTQHETPIAVYQYIASGLLGRSAFAGGYATALLGVLLHFVIGYVIVAVFILAASQIPFLGRPVWAILAGVVYGVAANMFMSVVVLPHSAAPKQPVTTALMINGLVAAALYIGLPVALAVVWYARRSKVAARVGIAASAPVR